VAFLRVAIVVVGIPFFVFCIRGFLRDGTRTPHETQTGLSQVVAQPKATIRITRRHAHLRLRRIL